MEMLKIQDILVYESDITGKRNYAGLHHKILDLVSFNLQKGKILGIVGPTGCGKTILLKAIAGLIEPTEGTIEKFGEDISGFKPHQRNISIVFQDYALYPHLTGKNNIGFKLFMKKDSPIQSDLRIKEIAEMMGFHEEKLLDRYPKNISLGERQRVAIGKAIAVVPDILLFDEPLSNVEENLRNKIRHDIRGLIKDNNLTAIYVSHNQVEIAEVADEIAVMFNGRIEQIDTYKNLYDDPKTLFVSLFIGEKTTNFIKADTMNSITGGKIKYSLTIRPDECSLMEGPDSVFVEGKVVLIENFIQDRTKIAFIEMGAELFGVQVPIDLNIQKGHQLKIFIPLKKSKFFDNQGESPGRVYNLW